MNAMKYLRVPKDTQSSELNDDEDDLGQIEQNLIGYPIASENDMKPYSALI